MVYDKQSNNFSLLDSSGEWDRHNGGCQFVLDGTHMGSGPIYMLDSTDTQLYDVDRDGPWNVVIFQQLTRLIAREDFINVQRRETFRPKSTITCSQHHLSKMATTCVNKACHQLIEAVTEVTRHSERTWARFPPTGTFYGHYIVHDDGTMLVSNNSKENKAWGLLCSAALDWARPYYNLISLMFPTRMSGHYEWL